MSSPKITAECFSELYASLETLEVQQIVSTLLKIPLLRDEIRKRVTPRRRRTKAMMVEEALSKEMVHSHSYMSSRTHPMLPAVKRKSRKSTPMKLKHNAPLKNSRTNHLSEPTSSAFTATQSVALEAQRDNFLQTGLSSPRMISPDISAIKPADIYNPLLHSSAVESLFAMNQLNKGFSPAVNPAVAYMNWYRLAASQFMSSSLLKPLPTVPRLDQHIFPSPANLPPTSYANVQNTELTRTEAVSDMEEMDREDGEVFNMKPVSNHNSPRSSDFESGSSGRENTTPTEVTCPDCKKTDLHMHMHRECGTRNEGVDDTSTPLIEPSASTARWEACAICSESVLGTDMIKHIRLQHASSQNPFKCDQCDETFKNKSTLKRHKITHTEGGGFSCNICGKVFAKPELLKRHEMIHTEVSKSLWPCPHCGKGFSNKYNLAVHERIHTGEMPFRCPSCPEKFRVKCSMQNHIKSKHMSVESSTDDDMRQTKENQSMSSPASSSAVSV